jgi:hypothetical protein
MQIKIAVEGAVKYTNAKINRQFRFCFPSMNLWIALAFFIGVHRRSSAVTH